MVVASVLGSSSWVQDLPMEVIPMSEIAATKAPKLAPGIGIEMSLQVLIKHASPDSNLANASITSIYIRVMTGSIVTGSEFR